MKQLIKFILFNTGNGVNKAANDVKTFSVNAADGVKNTANDAGKTIFTVANGGVNAVSKFGEDARKTISNKAKDVGDFASRTGKDIKDKLDDVIEDTGTFFGKVGTFFKEVGEKLGGNDNIFSQGWDKVTRIFKKFMRFVKEAGVFIIPIILILLFIICCLPTCFPMCMQIVPKCCRVIPFSCSKFYSLKAKNKIKQSFRLKNFKPKNTKPILKL